MHLSHDGIWQSLSLGILLLPAYVLTRSVIAAPGFSSCAACWHNAIKMSLKRLHIIHSQNKKGLLFMQKETEMEWQGLHLILEKQVNLKMFY